MDATKEIIYNIITGPPQHIVVTMHKRPDGDALGSSLAMKGLLDQYGHTVSVISPTVYPQYLSWMPWMEHLLVAEKTNKKELANILSQADVIFCLDCSEYHRLGAIADDVRASKALKLVIDHHPFTEEVLTDQHINYPNVPATAMILHDLCLEWGLGKNITKEIATCLYVGIACDTGFFCNASVNAQVHSTVAQLLELGIDRSQIQYYMLGNMPLRQLKFIAHAIQRRLIVLREHHLAYFAIPKKDIHAFKLQPGDTGGLILYALNIRDVYVAGLLTEQKNSVHISLRSWGDFPVNRLAEMHFQGGGHTNAAGGISLDSLKETGQKLACATADMLQSGHGKPFKLG